MLRQSFRRRRRRRMIIGSILAVAMIWVCISLGGALLNQSLGSSLPARFAEWTRQHGGASIVNWAENEWYSHNAPPVGGTLAKGVIKVPVRSAAVVNSSVPHLPMPAPMKPFASPPLPGEGQWSPVGRRVDGVPAIYVTSLRPDKVHTSYVVGVAWMDTKLLRATLYSGSWIPGGGPYPFTAPIKDVAARSLIAAFNAGFLMNDANGGYYTDHKMIIPLRAGAASFVVYKNGSSNIVAWAPHEKVSSDIVSVRQNLDLLVNNSHQVPGLKANDTSKWGLTLGNAVYVWRSGLGITADGALVYVGGPGLNITDLANLLVRAGAVRAMELDINTDWVNYSYYNPSTPLGLATPNNGQVLVNGMTGTPARYFQSWWARDFITMSARTFKTSSRG
ncbi:MAG: phosphodiester glycosidase family protein [Acidimicrobiales bacterium]